VNALLLLLGGSGERFGGKMPKQFIEAEFEGAQRPLFEITARKLLRALPIDILIFVAPKNTMGSAVVKPVISTLKADFPKRKIEYAAAGATRFSSFLNGVSAARKMKDLERLVIHDANRPYLTNDFLERVAIHMSYLSEDMPCFIPVLAAVDSLVRLDGKNVIAYENRNEISRVQTPQLLHYESFSQAMGIALNRRQELSEFTDEGSFCLSLGLGVGTFAGDALNTKITYAADLDPGKL